MNKKRSAYTIMSRLIVLVKPLTGIMILGIILGILGFLCAIFLTVLGGYGVIYGLNNIGVKLPEDNNSFFHIIFSGHLFIALVSMAIARGVLHYGEQYCNHYIAFRILALIRHKVFAALCKLCPAKLEGKDKGNLITLITSDIELLEVFFAHTLSPIGIAAVTSLIMALFIGSQHPVAGIIALCGYFTMGVVLPIWNGKRSSDAGMNFRNEVGNLNTFVLDSLYGLDEILQYNQGFARLNNLNKKSLKLSEYQKNLSRCEASQRGLTNLIIQLFSWLMFFTMLLLYQHGNVSFSQMLIATLAMMSSFGPTIALSALSNSLNQTLACGERVLSLLEEKPSVEDISGREKTVFSGADMENIVFSYDKNTLLENISLQIPKESVLGIHGPSGCGKSTLLKLLMRFWDVNSGEIHISHKNVKDINTSDLRDMSGYVTQDTVMFRNTIGENIKVAKKDAGPEEIEIAAKKASIHDFIMSLPKGYDTMVGELGDSLSDGEKQRIGIARAFLHNGDLILLDEPTSNLDILNEAIILKSLSKEKSGKTIVLVSHRASTMSIADSVYKF